MKTKHTSNRRKNGMFKHGVAVLSIDTEQIWGYVDLMDDASFRGRFPSSLPTHDRLLNCLCSAGISATWTVVGALSLTGTRGSEDPRFAGLPEDWTAKVPAGDEASAPHWYRRSFVQRLCKAQPAQDVGIHGGLSHLIWSDPETSVEIARRELNGGIRALMEIGILPRAFVFPRNLVTHLDVLASHGIRCYRGRASDLSEKLGFNLLGRVTRCVEELARWTPRPVWPEEVRPGLWNIPASLNLYSMRPAAKRIAPLRTRVERVRLGLDAAVRARGIFHLWIHPENLAEAPWSFGVFEDIVGEFARRRDAGDLEILNMNQVVDRVSAGTAAAPNENGNFALNIPTVLQTATQHQGT